MIVNFYELNERVGSISLVEGKLVPEPENIKFVLDTPVVVQGNAYTSDQPAEFLQNLHLAYRSPYFYAGKVQVLV